MNVARRMNFRSVSLNSFLRVFREPPLKFLWDRGAHSRMWLLGRFPLCGGEPFVRIPKNEFLFLREPCPESRAALYIYVELLYVLCGIPLLWCFSFVGPDRL